MKYFWVTLSLLTALTIGCNSDSSTDDPAADDGSANVTTEGGATDTVDLPPMDETELTSTGDANDESNDLADLPSEDPIETVKTEVLNRVSEVLQNRDLSQAVAIMEEGLQKLPNDPDIRKSLIVLRLQNDMRMASEEGKEAALASMKETEEVMTTLLGENPDLPPQLLQLFHINRARRHASGGDLEETMAALKQATEQGFAQFAIVDRDPFFEDIKSNENFEKRLMDLEMESFDTFDFDFELTDLEGNPIKLADFEGKLVIVDVWGTWCPPCKAEIPHFIQLQETYKDDLAIVGITYERHDEEEGAIAGVYEDEENRAEVIQRVSDFAKDQGINYSIALGDSATQQMIPDLTGFPTTLFIDRTGKVRLKVVGLQSEEKLEQYVNALLAEGA